MMLWIIAGIAALVLVAALAYLLLRREEPEAPQWDKPRNPLPWNGKPEDEDPGTTLGDVPPPAGVPIASTTMSLEMGLESAEVFVEDEEDITGPVARIVVSATGSTDPGLKREHNEDAFVLLPSYDTFAIADGMGGYAAGEVAARIAVDTLRECFDNARFGVVEEGVPRRGGELAAAVRLANQRIRDEASRDERKTGMGTTIVAARFSPGRKRVYIAHVGDSRCYRIRDNEIRKLTVDHTLGEMGITGKAAHKLSRAVGVFDAVDVDLTIDEPHVGDFYVLCSDGLYKMMPDDHIRDIVTAAPDLDAAVSALVQRANERGGRDNVSVVLVRVDEPALRPDRQSGEQSVY